MGLLVDGQWVDQWYDTQSTGGKFVRTVTQFRNWITPEASRVRQVRVASRQNRVVITCMCH